MSIQDNGRDKCRVCGHAVRLRRDDTAGSHKDGNGEYCTGAGHPPAGEPPCTPLCVPVGTIGVPFVPGQPHRSTQVCDSPSHRAEASAWVREVARGEPVFTPFPAKAPKTPAKAPRRQARRKVETVNLPAQAR